LYSNQFGEEMDYAMRESDYFLLITQRRLFKLSGVVGSAKVSTTGMIFTDYYRSIHFDVLKVMNEKAFIVPLKAEATNIQYNVTTDEM
jgi:hypothetical protein